MLSREGVSWYRKLLHTSLYQNNTTPKQYTEHPFISSPTAASAVRPLRAIESNLHFPPTDMTPACQETKLLALCLCSVLCVKPKGANWSQLLSAAAMEGTSLIHLIHHQSHWKHCTMVRHVSLSISWWTLAAQGIQMYQRVSQGLHSIHTSGALKTGSARIAQ